MSLRSSSTAVAEPFELLSQQIALAVKKRNSISLTPNVVKAIKVELKTVRSRQTYVPDAFITNLVSALDKYEHACSRLENTTFGVILETLLHGRHTRQKERGIYLLTESLHHESQKRSSSSSPEMRKAMIGKEYLQVLMTSFTNAKENARIRRLVGLLILQLLVGSEINRLTFEAGPEDNKRKLGTMVIEEQNEILRIVCGHLLKTLMACGIPKENLWPVGTNPTRYSGFPTSTQSEKHWNNAFQTYVDEIFSSASSAQDSGRIYFAQALNWDGTHLAGRTINILVDQDVSIYVQSNAGSFSESFEIPFNSISKVTTEETLLEGFAKSDNPLVDLVINLKTNTEIFCHRNALPENVHEIRITVKDGDLANEMCDDIKEPRSGLKVSQSMEIIAIAPILDNSISAHESPIAADSNKKCVEDQGDAVIACFSVERQDVGQNVECKTVIRESPKGHHIRETGVYSIPESGQPAIEENIYTTATSQNREARNQADNLKLLVGKAPFRVSAPVTREAEYDARASTDEGNDSRHENDRPGRKPLNRARPAGATLPPSAPKPMPSSRSQDVDNDKRSPIPSEPSAAKSPQRKIPMQSKVRPKLKAKKTVLKPAIPKQEIQKVKKYGLKPTAAPIITEKTASRSATAPDHKALAPKASATKTLASKASTHSMQTAAPKPAFVPKTLAHKALTSKQISNGPTAPKASSAPKKVAVLRVKNPKKLTSRLLVDMKALAGDAVRQSARKSPNPQFDLCPSPHNRETIDEQSTTNLGVGNQEKENREKRRASRLSAALADIDDIDQIDASSGELARPSSIDEPGQMPTQRESSLLLLEPRPSLLEFEEAYSPESPTMEATLEHFKSLETPIGFRRSPRLESRCGAKECTATPSVVADNMPLLDDHLARKTPLVSFSTKGPRNHGIIGSKKLSPPRVRGMRKLEKPKQRSLLTVTPIPEFGGKRKRKSEDVPVKEDDKRRRTLRLQESKAMASETKREMPLAFREAQDPLMPRNNPALRHAAVFGSQGSRVGENGSPRGPRTSIWDHADYEDMAMKALMSVKPTRSTGNEEAGMFYYDDDGLHAMVRSDKPNILDHPVASSSSLKPRSSSPCSADGVVKRYIPKKTMVHPKDFLQQKKLVDPFLERSPKMEQSNFTLRLQYGRQTRTQESTDHPEPYKRSFILNKDPEATLVNDENEVAIQKSSSAREVTSGSSDESRDLKLGAPAVRVDDIDQTARDEWRIALKPHQRGILEALYQVSNDLVRYLIRHERALQDVLAEYEMGGVKLMEQIEGDHQDEKRRTHYELDKIMKTVGKEYRDSQQAILRSAEDMRAQSVRKMEKKWMQEQDLMQRLVEEGIRKCR